MYILGPTPAGPVCIETASDLSTPNSQHIVHKDRRTRPLALRERGQAEPEDLSRTKMVRFKSYRNCVPKEAFARYRWEKRLTSS
jgi:hypothetical protein